MLGAAACQEEVHVTSLLRPQRGQNFLVQITFELPSNTEAQEAVQCVKKEGLVL